MQLMHVLIDPSFATTHCSSHRTDRDRISSTVQLHARAAAVRDSDDSKSLTHVTNVVRPVKNAVRLTVAESR